MILFVEKISVNLAVWAVLEYFSVIWRQLKYLVKSQMSAFWAQIELLQIILEIFNVDGIPTNAFFKFLNKNCEKEALLFELLRWLIFSAWIAFRKTQVRNFLIARAEPPIIQRSRKHLYNRKMAADTTVYVFCDSLTLVLIWANFPQFNIYFVSFEHLFRFCWIQRFRRIFFNFVDVDSLVNQSRFCRVFVVIRQVRWRAWNCPHFFFSYSERVFCIFMYVSIQKKVIFSTWRGRLTNHRSKCEINNSEEDQSAKQLWQLRSTRREFTTRNLIQSLIQSYSRAHVLKRTKIENGDVTCAFTFWIIKKLCSYSILKKKNVMNKKTNDFSILFYDFFVLFRFGILICKNLILLISLLLKFDDPLNF